MIIVDSFTKYLDIKLMTRTSCKHVIEKLRQFFTVYGLVKSFVTDNDLPFNSFELSNFCCQHNIKLIHSPPYHAQSN